MISTPATLINASIFPPPEPAATSMRLATAASEETSVSTKVAESPRARRSDATASPVSASRSASCGRHSGVDEQAGRKGGGGSWAGAGAGAGRCAHDHVGALLGEERRCGLADAVSGACDDRGLARHPPAPARGRRGGEAAVGLLLGLLAARSEAVGEVAEHGGVRGHEGVRARSTAEHAPSGTSGGLQLVLLNARCAGPAARCVPRNRGSDPRELMMKYRIEWKGILG